MSLFIVNLASFIIGCCFAWTSPAIPRLNGSLEPKHNPLGEDASLTAIEESWIASLVPLGAAASSLISGVLADKRGRKEILIIAVLISIIGFGCMHFANSVLYICIARMICGISIGTIFTVVPMYVGEISEDSNRGLLGMFMVLFVMIGIVFTYGVGSVVTLNTLNLLNFIAPVLFMITFDWFVPESPHWLISKKEFNKAEKSLTKLRSQYPQDKISSELEQIKTNIEEELKNKSSLKDILTKKEFLKGIFITCGLVLFQQLSGINIILFYMHSIFEETGSSLSPDLSAIIISLVQVVACVISSILVDHLGRRILLLFSSVGMCLSIIAFAVYFYLKEVNDNVENIFWLPILSIVCFMIAYAAGFGPIPFVILGELFPQQTKSFASTVTIFVCLMGTFCTTTFFPMLVIYLGMAYTFLLLAVCCFVSLIFTFVFIPETKGKSLIEIQELLKK
ncbi:sugar transporter-like [Holotrichia oblita]|uniref:Sugar transporter-like n=1 Tax=Holotrichia oblita TaxID=644536 RepID=A0ACB9SN82_HOLOL|nr:sugar transporter-like [Holotrichia oblita]